MRGPNYWSIRRTKLIVMRLDLGAMEDKPSNKVRGFPERLEKMFPSMYKHRCSVGKPGGFFQRVREGTWMGHIAEHIALEIQTTAGMFCGFGRTRETSENGVYNVVFSYVEERVGRYAAKASVAITVALVADEFYDLEKDIRAMREIREEERFGPSTGSIIDAAKTRDIPFIRLNRHSLVQLGYGVNQKRIRATISGQTSSIAVELAGDKEDTKDLLAAASIPVPNGRIVYNEDEMYSAIKKIKFPVVIKPVNGNHGKGATINVKSDKEALVAFHAAQKYSRRVIVETFITGFDYRLLVIDYKFVAAALRTPAHIKGDGKTTIKDLIDKVNEDPRRGYGHENVLTEITIDQMSKNILKNEKLKMDSVLEKDRVLLLKTTANLSTGGTSTDVTELVHPYNIFMAERISRIIGLDICGIDVMAPNVTEPLSESGGAVLEVNAAPGFRMHLAPTEGLGRNVAEHVIDMLFPPGTNARIPIVGVSGTNGKTTTVRLIAHIMKSVGKKVGYTTTDGIYIQNRMLQTGDCSGPASAKFVLKDPTVDFVVLECARGGLLRAGLGFEKADIGIVTNITADHLGLKDIDTLEQLAKVKSIVVEAVSREGYSILNADDDHVFNMGRNVRSKIALFSMEEDNPHVKEHCDNGGLAAIYENGYITINKGGWKIRVDKVTNMPLTFSGKAVFMIQNILPAALTAFIRNVKIEDLRLALQTFIPSPAQTPGRMNMFEFQNFTVMLDYAHNPAGLRAIGKFLEKIDASPKIGIIAGTGDRRDEDIREMGYLSSELFDQIIIRQDRLLRGRTADEIISLLIEGIKAHDKRKPIKIITNEADAIEKAIKRAKKGSMLVILSEAVPVGIETVLRLKEAEDKVKVSKADIPNIS